MFLRVFTLSGVPIMKVGNKPSTLDNYPHYAACFMGYMNMCANSIELVLDSIVRKTGEKPQGTLGSKINRIQELKKEKKKGYEAIQEELIKRLKDFNRNWNICKHGLPVTGPEVVSPPIECPIVFDEIKLHKNNIPHPFDKKKIDRIYGDFTRTMRELTELQKKF